MSPVCQTYRQKEFLCDGILVALRRFVDVMCQDTPLTKKHLDAYSSASLAEKTRNGEPNQKSPHLPEQFYRDDLSMHI